MNFDADVYGRNALLQGALQVLIHQSPENLSYTKTSD
jgi:hypothetical protein